MHEGLVISTTGSWYEIRFTDSTLNRIVQCRLRGNFRLKGIKTTNPIAVGDKVIFNFEKDQETGIIQDIIERKNVIIRKSTNLSKQKHIIASNVDLLIVVATPAFPRTSTGFIDRLLITAEAFHIPALIILNKSDLFVGEAKELTEYYKEIYQSAGYPTLQTSTKTADGIDELKIILKNKTTLISGHSGVGKSSLVNQLDPSQHLKTGEMSLAHQKGKHTTTFARLLSLNFGADIIDTPGIKEFGIIDFEPWELGHWFPDIKKHISKCRFANCTHQHEPECAVKQAVENEIIHYERYKNYLSILNNIEEQ